MCLCNNSSVECMVSFVRLIVDMISYSFVEEFIKFVFVRLKQVFR